MSTKYIITAIFLLGLNFNLLAQEDLFPIHDCIGKEGNPELYRIPKMKLGEILKGTWYDLFAGTPGDSVAWASSFYKHSKISLNYGAKPKNFSKLKDWAEETCGDSNPFGIQYNEQNEACFNRNGNMGKGEIILSPISLEKKEFYLSLTFKSKKFPIERVFEWTSFPKKVRFYFLLPEEVKPGARGGNVFKNLKLVGSQEADLPFEAGYIKIPIQNYDKIKSQSKVDNDKVYFNKIIVATEIIDIYESKGMKGEEPKTCIDEISNAYDESYYKR